MTRPTIRKAGRALATVVALVLISAGAARAAEPSASDSILSSLGQGALAVVRIGSPADAYGVITTTRLGAEVAEALAPMTPMGMMTSQLRWMAMSTTGLTLSAIERLLERETVVVVFEGDGAPGGAPPLAVALDLGEDVDLVRNAMYERLLPQLVASGGGEETIEATQVIRLQAGPQGPYLRLAGHLLIIGSREAVLRFQPSGSPSAWPAEPESPDVLAATFVNLARLLELVEQGALGNASDLAAIGLLAVDDVRAATVIEDGGFMDTIVADVRPDGEGFLAKALALAMGEARAPAVVPRDYALYASMQIESGEAIFALIQDLVRQTGGEAGMNQFRFGVDQVDLAFGVNVEWELLPTIGNEAFVAIRMPDFASLPPGTGPQQQDFAPIFGVTVRDEAALLKLVERFTDSIFAQQWGWQLGNDSHEGIEFRMLESAFQPVQIAFAFIEGFVVISLDSEVMRDVVAAIAHDDTLDTDPERRAVEGRLPAGGHARLYLNPGPVQEVLMALLSRAPSQPSNPLMPMLAQLIPHLGGYGVAAAGADGQLHIVAYGDVPAAYSLVSVLSIVGIADAQEKAAGGAEPQM